MDNGWKNEIYDALSGVDGAEVYFYYPEAETTFPCVTYSRLGQDTETYADDGSYISSVEIKLDVWDTDPDNAEVFANAASAKLKDIEYYETFRCDLYEYGTPPLHHVSMRFKKVY